MALALVTSASHVSLPFVLKSYAAIDFLPASVRQPGQPHNKKYVLHAALETEHDKSHKCGPGRWGEQLLVSHCSLTPPISNLSASWTGFTLLSCRMSGLKDEGYTRSLRESRVEIMAWSGRVKPWNRLHSHEDNNYRHQEAEETSRCMSRNQAYLVNYQNWENTGKPFTSQVAESILNRWLTPT